MTEGLVASEPVVSTDRLRGHNQRIHMRRHYLKVRIMLQEIVYLFLEERRG